MVALLPDRWFSEEHKRDLAWCLMAFAFWLNANPYIGIEHDARLYAVAAYRWLSPAAYARDPWFLFGSQDDFTLFSPLLAGLFSVFGVGSGALIATVLQGMGFAVSCLLLARTALDRRAYPFAVLLLTSFPVLYSSGYLLHVTEGFVTARGYAIVCSLIGLALSVKGRVGLGLVFHAMGMLLHPIMALPSAAVSVLLVLPARWRIWSVVAVWTAFIAVLLAACYGYLLIIDGQWRWYVQSVPLVFIDTWLPDAVPALVFWAIVLVEASFYGSTRLRTTYGLVIVVAASGVAFSLLCAVVPWATGLQAQFWRGLWLFKLLALLALADLFWHFVLRPESSNCRMMSLGFLLTLHADLSHPLLGVLVLVVMLSLRRTDRLETFLRQRSEIYWGLLTILLLCALPRIFFELADRVRDVKINDVVMEGVLGFWRSAGLGMFALGAWWVSRRCTTTVLMLVALAAVLASSALWDSRSPARIADESRYRVVGETGAFNRWIPHGALVFWHQNTERLWFELGTASYAGSIHLNGLVFSKERTGLLVDRYSRLLLASKNPPPADWLSQDRVQEAALPIATRRTFVKQRVLTTYENAVNPTDKGIQWLCRDPDLDFVIAPRSELEAIAQVTDATGNEWSIHRCTSLAVKNM